MSQKLHIARKYEIDWVETPYLNYKPEEFTYLLGALDCQVYTEHNEDYSIWNMEIDVEQFENALSTLKEFDNYDDSNKEDIVDCIKSCEFTLQDAINCFEMVKKYAVIKDGYIHLSFY